MARKTPVLLRPMPLSGGVAALTNYRRVDRGEGLTVIHVVGDGKHDVTADFDAIVCETLLDPDSPDIVSILDGVADGWKLTVGERAQVRAFRDRLRMILVRHNEEGHGRAGG